MRTLGRLHIFGEMLNYRETYFVQRLVIAFTYKVLFYTTGIGNGIAKALAAGGAEIAALDIVQDNLDKLKSEVGKC